MHMEEALRSADNTTEADYLKRKHIWFHFVPSCSTKCLEAQACNLLSESYFIHMWIIELKRRQLRLLFNYFFTFQDEKDEQMYGVSPFLLQVQTPELISFPTMNYLLILLLPKLGDFQASKIQHHFVLL